MASRENKTECMVTCWGIAAVVGLVAMVMLYRMAEFSALQAIFTGGLIGTVLGLILMLTVCRSQTAASDLASNDKPATRYAAQAQDRRASRVASTMGTDAKGEGANPAPAPAAASPAASAEPASVTTATPSVAVKAAEVKVAEAPQAAKTEPASEAKAEPEDAAAPAAKDSRPALLTAARPEGKDDLKLISGVGPKLEQTLNDLGIYHFDQVSKWKKKEIAWVDDNLRFKGRIERDDWMAQAKILAKGGETEFSKKKKKT